MANFSRGRGVVVRGRAPKRVTEWVASADQGFVVVGAGVKVLIQSVQFAQSITIVRLRGLLSMIPNIASADQTIVGAVGFGVVSDQALAAGVASMPGPWSDPDWDGWFMWMGISQKFEFASGVGLLTSSVQQIMDSKAMRKVGPNEAVVAIGESQAIAFDVSVPSRMLIKLS